MHFSQQFPELVRIQEPPTFLQKPEKPEKTSENHMKFSISAMFFPAFPQFVRKIEYFLALPKCPSLRLENNMKENRENYGKPNRNKQKSGCQRI
jgi:hypothetical protein